MNGLAPKKTQTLKVECWLLEQETQLTSTKTFINNFVEYLNSIL